MIIFYVMDVYIVSQSIVGTADISLELWLIGAWLESVVGLKLVTNECTDLLLLVREVPGTIFGDLDEILVRVYVELFKGPTQ